MLMDTRQLAAFCAVVERKSFSQAAERLGVTQPAVSLQIRSLDQLRGEKLIVMQEGAGVRQVIEDELRKAGVRLRDLDLQLELGLQESVRSAVVAGHGIAFISRLAIEADLDAGRIAIARVRGLDPVREIFLARASGRSETRAARAFTSFAREHLPA